MRGPNIPKLLIGTKFALALLVLIPMLAAVALVGDRGLGKVNHDAQSLSGGNVQTILRTTELQASLTASAALALRLIPTVDQRSLARLNVKLDEEIATVSHRIDAVGAVDKGDQGTRARLAQILADWRVFLRFRSTGALNAVGFDRPSVLRDERLAGRVSAIFDRLSAVTSRQVGTEVAEAARASKRAHSTYSDSRLLLIVIALSALLAGGAAVVLLVRNVVPRIRAYASFAAAVSGGDLSKRLEPRGNDELAELGRALDAMVSHRRQEEEQAASQTEFSEMTQLAEAEEEAHDLLRRQLERSAPGSSAVVLNRNNSDDRLTPMTTIPEGSLLSERLVDAVPRSCLAIRFARTHREGPDSNPLVSCEVCGGAGFSTCEPLLVSGEVIGAALVQHPEPLAEHENAALTASVNQASPVLGNLRNLALAEIRAATDSLTGLPNSRDARDTLKRMAARASRTVSPLAALLLDVDHFKRINDSFGHARGDDVLAAVGVMLRSTLRESDFAARYGGEEFLILLPDTGREQALLVAEKVRDAMSTLNVSGVEREVTASLGVAVIPDDAVDGTSLLRYADHALYAAKAAGRNRVHAAEPTPLISTNGAS